MASKIEWTQDTWNVVVGCNKVSAGCKNCYAMKMAYRLMHSPNAAIADKYNGTAVVKSSGVEWTGRVNTVLADLVKPINTKKPTLYFVNSMGDTFHDDVPFDFIDEIFLTMYVANQHAFQVLTKRAKRMYEYFEWKKQGNGWQFVEWPLPNVWLGVSVEDQAATLRIPYLLQVPAAVRFLSVEPLVGPVDLTKIEVPIGNTHYRLNCLSGNLLKDFGDFMHIDWVIVGGESGGKARPMQVDWAIMLRDQCIAADVPFFFKQWGHYDAAGKNVGKAHSGNLLDGKQYKQMPKIYQQQQQTKNL